MNLRKLFVLSVLGAAGFGNANQAEAQYRPQPIVVPVIRPIRPEQPCVPVYRPVTISTTTLKPCVPVPPPQPAPRPCPKPIKPR